MISCEEATAMVVKNYSEPLTIGDRLRLLLHHAMCRFCALFAKQNKIIDEAAMHLDETVSHTMSESTKAKILREIQK